MKFPILSAINPNKNGAKMTVIEETPLMMPVSSTVSPNDLMWIVMKENNDPIPIQLKKQESYF